MQTQAISKAPHKMRIEAIQDKRTFEEIDRLYNIARDAWVVLYTTIQTGEPIPISDLQITEPEQFIKETPNSADIYIF